MGCPGWPCCSPSVTEKSRATASAQAFAFVTPGLTSPIQLQCEQGLVNTPDVCVCCPCHGLNQCRLHTSALQSKMLVGWSFPSAGCVLIWVSVSSRGLSVSLSPRSPWGGRFLIRYLLWWLSFISTVKSALYLQCKGQHASSSGSLCLCLPQRTISLSWIHQTIYRENCWPWVCWWSLQSTISSDSWTFLPQGHRGPRQGTCLKSQRPLLEDSWTSSCMHGTPVQPLSQGLCGMGKVGLGNPNCDLVSSAVTAV